MREQNKELLTRLRKYVSEDGTMRLLLTRHGRVDVLSTRVESEARR
jgi:hypothetical protein